MLIKLKGDEKGEAKLLLRNKAGNLGVSHAYSLDQLPYPTLSKNLVALEDGYLTRIGPAYPNYWDIEGKSAYHLLPKFREIREFRITFEVAMGKERVSQIEGEIQAIGLAGRRSTIRTRWKASAIGLTSKSDTARGFVCVPVPSGPSSR